MAVASLAVGSVALTAAPATAGTPSGVTRELIANSARGTFTDDNDTATKTLISKVCKSGTVTDEDYTSRTFLSSLDVDGVLVRAYVDRQEGVENSGRYCTFAALATVAPYASLSGTVTISADQLDRSARVSEAAPLSTSFTLSGDVYVTDPITDPDYGFSPTGVASGAVTKVEQATTSTSRVSTPKSTAVKSKALASYKRSIASAKAKLSTSLKKAGASSSKKSAARKAYAARKKAAKATLHVRWSSDKKTVVTTTVGKTTTNPFSISADNRF
ncbi:hypothetical protein DX116_05500 [Aeromicrobium endophyticum]|uniref:Calcium-binding protein n=1 Tax=Aeromicrobium endophyticum TaxID=2292704 RepID=A0A371PAR8_9ACTN|nr:hypothetical protein DX116_05500 [Aeromicrobium endophyticum]